jgi:hypothetical protein
MQDEIATAPTPGKLNRLMPEEQARLKSRCLEKILVYPFEFTATFASTSWGFSS